MYRTRVRYPPIYCKPIKIRDIAEASFFKQSFRSNMPDIPLTGEGSCPPVSVPLVNLVDALQIEDEDEDEVECLPFAMSILEQSVSPDSLSLGWKVMELYGRKDLVEDHERFVLVMLPDSVEPVTVDIDVSDRQLMNAVFRVTTERSCQVDVQGCKGALECARPFMMHPLPPELPVPEPWEWLDALRWIVFSDMGELVHLSHGSYRCVYAVIAMIVVSDGIGRLAHALLPDDVYHQVCHLPKDADDDLRDFLIKLFPGQARAVDTLCAMLYKEYAAAHEALITRAVTSCAKALQRADDTAGCSALYHELHILLSLYNVREYKKFQPWIELVEWYQWARGPEDPDELPVPMSLVLADAVSLSSFSVRGVRRLFFPRYRNGSSHSWSTLMCPSTSLVDSFWRFYSLPLLLAACDTLARHVFFDREDVCEVLSSSMSRLVRHLHSAARAPMEARLFKRDMGEETVGTRKKIKSLT
jgi:hypothetical protein